MYFVINLVVLCYYNKKAMFHKLFSFHYILKMTIMTLFTRCNNSECVCEVLAQNTDISFLSLVKIATFRV